MGRSESSFGFISSSQDKWTSTTSGSIVLDQLLLRDETTTRFRFSKSYEQALEQWRWYQVRAYVTHAIETLFSAVLSEAWVDGMGVPVSDLISGVITAAKNGSAADSLPLELRGLLSGSIDTLIERLERRISSGKEGLWMEPEMARTLVQGHYDEDETIYAAFLLLFKALARMRILRSRNGLSGWLGGRDARRLPPQELLSLADDWVDERAPVDHVAGRVLRDLVIRQHAQNAFRKLEADPTRDTSRFVLDGGRLIAHSLHPEPSSSYPRYRNAIAFLRDLRYLASDGQPTKDGIDLAAAIEEALT